MARLEIQETAPEPTEDSPIVFDGNNVPFPRAEDAVVEDISNAYPSLAEWQDYDPERYGKYMRAIYNEYGIEGLADPLAHAPPHTLVDGWLNLTPMTPEDIERLTVSRSVSGTLLVLIPLPSTNGIRMQVARQRSRHARKSVDPAPNPLRRMSRRPPLLSKKWTSTNLTLRAPLRNQRHPLGRFQAPRPPQGAGSVVTPRSLS